MFSTLQYFYIKGGEVNNLTYDILGQSVSVDKLSIGAKINKLFHERLPLNLAERKIDEKNLRREIKIVIQNIRGVRSGLFTPDMAFEVIYPLYLALLIADYSSTLLTLDLMA